VVATQRQTVCLDNFAAPLLRVVFDRVTDLEHGIETAFARHRGSDVAVGRPANPRCLGRDFSWQDGHWRNIYEAKVTIERGDADRMFQRGRVNVGDVEAKLPLMSFSPTRAIQQFVGQHLR